jgi:hypothetical protein
MAHIGHETNRVHHVIYSAGLILNSLLSTRYQKAVQMLKTAENQATNKGDINGRMILGKFNPVDKFNRQSESTQLKLFLATPF